MDDLYVIRSADGALKIGRAQDVSRRRSQLQVGSHGKLTILAIFPGMGCREREVLAHLESVRGRGEWFPDNDEVRQKLGLAVGLLFWGEPTNNPWHFDREGNSPTGFYGAP